MKTTFESHSRPEWVPRSGLRPSAKDTETGVSEAHFYQSPEWAHLRAKIMTALRDFPEAQESLVRALRSIHDMETPDAPTS